MLAVAAAQLRANVLAIVNGQPVSLLPAWSSAYTMDRLSRALRKDHEGMARIGYIRHLTAAVSSNCLTIQPKKAPVRCANSRCSAPL